MRFLAIAPLAFLFSVTFGSLYENGKIGIAKKGKSGTVGPHWKNGKIVGISKGSGDTGNWSRYGPAEQAQLSSALHRSLEEKMANSSTSSRQGLNFDICSSSEGCVGDRECLEPENLDPCNGSGDCLCSPPTLPLCDSSDECAPLEICAFSESIFDVPFCISASMADLLELPEVSLTSSGYTLSSCDSDQDCQGTRNCEELESTTCPVGADCLCYPSEYEYVNCSSSDECESGEVCVAAPTENSSENGPICVATDQATGLEMTPVESQVPQDPSSGYTLSSCASDQDCVGTRNCEELGTTTCPVGADCLCYPSEYSYVGCSSTVDCDGEEECLIFIFEDGSENNPICVAVDQATGLETKTPDSSRPPVPEDSEIPQTQTLLPPPLTRSPTPSPSPSECIETAWLKNHGLNEGILHEHGPSLVLCHEGIPCGTKGHLLRKCHSKDQCELLTYAEFCNQNGECSEKIVPVSRLRSSFDWSVVSKMIPGGARVTLTSLSVDYESSRFSVSRLTALVAERLIISGFGNLCDAAVISIAAITDGISIMRMWAGSFFSIANMARNHLSL